MFTYAQIATDRHISVLSDIFSQLCPREGFRYTKVTRSNIATCVALSRDRSGKKITTKKREARHPTSWQIDLSR